MRKLKILTGELPEHKTQELGKLTKLGKVVECEKKQTVPDNQPTAFEQTGDPVSCPYWFRVCWAVQKYQQHCTRDTGCLTYKFLQRQDEVAAPEILEDWKRSTEAVKRHLEGGGISP